MASLLADFLLARIADERETAVSATVGPWQWDNDGDLVTVLETPLPDCPDDFPEIVLWAGGFDAAAPYVEGRRQDREHIVRWDPTRVLAGCRARQRIVDLLLRNVAGSHGLCDRCIPCLTLRLLSLPYQGHPDYHPGWRP